MNPFTFHFEMIQGVPVLQLVDSRRKTSTVSLVFRAGYRFDKYKFIDPGIST